MFDMDGLKIRSQPYWQTTQVETLPTLGVLITRQDAIDLSVEPECCVASKIVRCSVS